MTQGVNFWRQEKILTRTNSTNMKLFELVYAKHLKLKYVIYL